MGALEAVGSITSIIGLGLSVFLIIRTGKIQDNVRGALNQNSKVQSYNKHKHGILTELYDCARFFLDEHTPEDQKLYIHRMDVALSKLQTFHPNLTTELDKKIKTIRASYSGKDKNETFGFLAIMQLLDDIIAILEREDSFLYD